MKIVTALFLVITLASVIALGQKKERQLIFLGEVIHIQETNLAEGVANAFHMVDYKVVKVCKGDLRTETIRVAHIVGTAKNLKPGDVVCRQIRTTDVFREVAKDSIEYDGFLVPEDLISDHIFEGFNRTCSCPVP